MPKALERQLKAEANKHKDWSDERKDRYVYGGLRSQTGWEPLQERKKSKRYSSRGKS